MTQLQYYMHLLLINKYRTILYLIFYIIILFVYNSFNSYTYCMTNEDEIISETSITEENLDMRFSNISFTEEPSNNMFIAESKRSGNNEFISQEKGVWIGAEGKVEITKTETGYRVEIKRNTSNDVIAEKKDI